MMKRILFLIVSSMITLYGCKNDGFVWGGTQFEMDGEIISTRDYTFNRPLDKTEIRMLRSKNTIKNKFPTFKNLNLKEDIRFRLHKEDELEQNKFISVIEWGGLDIATCGHFDLLEEDSINNWIIFDDVGKNFGHIKGRFSGTYVFVENICGYPRPIDTDTVRIRNGIFNLRD
jgi:hypothetical protein